jgi:hypothetical protein
MNRLQKVGGGSRLHLADEKEFRRARTEKRKVKAICGQRVDLHPPTMKGITSTCKRCATTRTVAQRPVEPDLATRRRALIENLPVTPLRDVRGFRMEGGSDIYTVVMGHDHNGREISLCTCMAAKVNPQTRCKHQERVGFLVAHGLV